MYFKFFKLHNWGKRSAENRRRLIQGFPGNMIPVPSGKVKGIE